MKHRATRELFDYWNGLRGARTAPERCDIDPAAIRTVLPDTFMLDVAADFPVRLAGTRVNALLDAGQAAGQGAGRAAGREAGQMGSFLDLWRRQERHNLAAVLDAVVDGASPVAVGAAGAPVGQAPCAFELLFLPLRHFGKTHSRILGIVTPAEPPAWLGLAPMGPLALRSLRVIGADELGRRAPPRLVDEMRPGARRHDELRARASHGAALDFAAIGRAAVGEPIPGRPFLRVIEGGLRG